MDETDIEKELKELKAPPASEFAKKKTLKDAGDRFSKSRGPIVSWRGPAMRSAMSLSVVMIIVFGALSYSVTQSTRSGSPDSGREQSLIASSQVSQYPAGVRTALVRMIIGGITADDLYFNTPSDFGEGRPIDDMDDDPADEMRAVFHPAGGGAPYQLAPPEVMSGSQQGQWVFSGQY
jgi:hypothetical protein